MKRSPTTEMFETERIWHKYFGIRRSPAGSPPYGFALSKTGPMSVLNLYACQNEQGQAAIVTAGAPLQSIPAWHPQLAAVEKPAGTWYMVAQYGRCYGIISLIRRGDELGYRLDTWATAPADRQTVGYYRTLRAAAEAAHARFLRGHGQPGAPNEVRKPA